MSSTEVRAYHFVGKTLRDGSPVPPDGVWLVYDGPIVICKTGLHASKHPMDALQYAPGETLCLVDCAGIVTEHHDKLACSRRRIVARFDATGVLWEMARWSALRVIHLWNAPQVVCNYLTTGDDSLRTAAWAAAHDAAQDTVWAASSRYAAWAAAWAASSQAAALIGAWAASRDAARAAAWAVSSQDATWDAQRDQFHTLVNAKFAKLMGNA